MVRFDIAALKQCDKFTRETIDPHPLVEILRRDVPNNGIHRMLSEFLVEGDRYVAYARRLGISVDREVI